MRSFNRYIHSSCSSRLHCGAGSHADIISQFFTWKDHFWKIKKTIRRAKYWVSHEICGVEIMSSGLSKKRVKLSHRWKHRGTQEEEMLFCMAVWEECQIGTYCTFNPTAQVHIKCPLVLIPCLFLPINTRGLAGGGNGWHLAMPFVWAADVACVRLAGHTWSGKIQGARWSGLLAEALGRMFSESKAN